MEEMDISEIYKVMSNFFKANKIQLLIELPEGTMDANVEDNMCMGPTLQLYMLLHAFESTFEKMIKEIHADPSDKEAILDDLFGMIKGEVLKDDK